MPTILVVDDKPRIIELMRDWLALHRYDVITASDGHTAIRIAQEQHPDLVLLDVQMEGLSGIEVCRLLRSEPRTRNIPIILISGRDPFGGRVEGLLAGASDYVTKPVNLEELNERMQLLLNGELATDRSARLLYETVHMAVDILRCRLAWLLTISRDDLHLVGRAIAAAGGEQVAERFIRIVANGENHFEATQDETSFEISDRLIRAAQIGGAEFNLTVNELHLSGDSALARASEAANIQYISIVPLQTGGVSLGVLVLGSQEPQDIQTTRGQQLLAAVIGHAAATADHAGLVDRLLERESEGPGERSLYEEVINTMTDGVVLYDQSGHITFANRRLVQMTGYSSDVLARLSVEDLCVPEDRERVQSVIKANGPAKNSSSFEINLLCADGRSLPVLAVRSGRAIARKEGVHEHVLVLTDLSAVNARKQALVKQSEYLVALNRASQAASSADSLNDALQIILNEALSTLKAQVATVLLRPPEAQELFCHTAVGPYADELRGQHLTVNRSIAGYVVRECQPVLLEDAFADERFEPGLFVHDLQIRGMAAVPILVQEDAVGVVEVISDRQGAFSLEDIQLLQGLARSAGMAIENASLFGETQQQLRELRLLLQVSEAASSTLTPETVVETIARQLIDALHVNWCTISSWERGDNTLIKLAEVAEMVGSVSQKRTLSLADHAGIRTALASGKPFVASAEASSIEVQLRQVLSSADRCSTLSLPISIQGEMVGLIELYHSSNQITFSAADIDRSQAVLASWRNAFPADLNWNAPECLQALGRDLIAATGSSWCVVWSSQPGRQLLTTIYETGQAIWPVGLGSRSHLDDSSLRRIALLERTAVSARLDDPHLSAEDRSALSHVQKGSLLVAPLVAHGEAIGLVELIDQDARRAFSESDLSLAQAIANVIGNALENGRLYSALAKRAAQLEAAYNDLRDADRTTEEMIQNVSHELRTPLASIIGYTDMLVTEDLGPLADEQKHAIEVINMQGRLLSRMVSDIITVQEVGNEPLERKLCSLKDLADSAIQSLKLEAAKNKIEFVTEFSPDAPKIYVDEERILQVFENLIGNAVKFSPDGGKVLISIRDIGHSLRVDINDQGIGIPEDDHDRIWRRFYQVDGSRTRRFSGLGLGLTIVKQVVEEHEGRVSVQSTPGKGSTFTFILPKLETSIVTGTPNQLS